jgi:hypothetical protein
MKHDTADAAIAESIARNCTARVTNTPENREYLLVECDDHVDEQEFWGADWRVHCEGE